MVDQIEARVDAPQAPADNAAASNALISEVNNDRNSAKPTDTKPADQSWTQKVTDAFGSLTIFGDDSKDTTTTAKSGGDTSAPTAGGDTSAPPAGDANKPADTKSGDTKSSDTSAPAAADKPATTSETVASASVEAVTAKPADTAATPADTTATPADATATPAAADKPSHWYDSITSAASDIFSSKSSDATPAAPGDSTPAASTGDNTADPKLARSGDTAGAPGDTVTGKDDIAKAPDASKIDSAAEQKIQDDPQVKAEQKKLNDDIDKKEKGLKDGDPELQKLEDMRKNMEIFKERAATEHPPLSPEEVAKTFKSVSHMIEAKDGDHALSQKDRNDLAKEVMLHAADPTTIDQGAHQTCNVTTAENRMFSRNPAAAASLIDQVATTGEYHIPGYKPGDPEGVVKIDPKMIVRSGEENSSTATDGNRSYASEVFQVTAVNAYYHTHDLQVKDGNGNVTATYPKGTIEYRQDVPSKAGDVPPNATGEGLYDSKTGQLLKDGNNYMMEPHMTAENIADTYNLISDRKESGFTFVNKDYGPSAGSDVTQFNSPDELKAKLIEARDQGKMPIILYVHTGQEPFYSDFKGKDAGGAGDGHVVTITGIDDNGNAMIENQWGQSSKHSVSVKELYTATETPKDAISDLKKEVADNAKSGHVDFTKEAELLRLRHTDGDLQDDAAYKKELIGLTRLAAADAAQNHGGILDRQTEKELDRQLEKEYSYNGGAEDLKKALGADVAKAIAGDLTGNLNYDSNNAPTSLSKDYGTENLKKDSQAIYEAGDEWWFNDKTYKKLDDALSNKSPAEIRALEAQFEKDHPGTTLKDYINKKFDGHKDQRDKALAIINNAENGQAA